LKKLIRSGHSWGRVTVALFLAALSCPAHAADKNPDDLIAKHLSSIGTAAARASLKSLAIQGTLRFKILVGGAGEAVGSWGRVSEQRKSNFVMRFGTGNWRGEQFVYDDNKASFAAATLTHEYTTFAQFVSGHDFIIKDGILGGVLSTAWALENLDPNRLKLHSLGHKKINGHELEGIECFSKGGSDMTVKMYFDPDTHRHVMTIYSVENVPRNVENGINRSAQQQQLRYTIEERFSEFQPYEEIMLPHHYDLQYTEELQNGSTRIYDWEMTADNIHSNVQLDPSNFQLK
jgi:hypothetical protein